MRMRKVIYVVVAASIWTVLAKAQTAAEHRLPIDEYMAAMEAAVPELRGQYATIEEEISELGEIEPNWATSGISTITAIELRDGDIQQDVIGEWEVGGHGAYISGGLPLPIPPDWYRYSIREYDGPVEYNHYYRLAGVPANIVIHTFGTASRIGNAECQRSEGMELFSSEPWQDWPAEAAIVAFGGSRSLRDDPRVYCTLYQIREHGGFRQLAYTREGRPYIAVNSDTRGFVITPRKLAIERIFAVENSLPIDD